MEPQAVGGKRGEVSAGGIACDADAWINAIFPGIREHKAQCTLHIADLVLPARTRWLAVLDTEDEIAEIVA